MTTNQCTRLQYQINGVVIISHLSAICKGGFFMSDYRQQFIDRIQRSIATVLDADDLFRVTNKIISVLDDYEVAPRSTEIMVYDDTNERLLKQYVACLAVEGKSKRTVVAYVYVLRKFLEYIGRPIDQIGRYDIRSFVAHEKNRGLSDVSIRNEQSYISAFMKWAVIEEIIPSNPCDTVKTIKFSEPDKQPFSDVELDALRSACKDTKERAIIELLATTGIRVSELTKLDLSDVDFSKLSVHVRQGKGGKSRTVYMTDVTRIHIQKYLLSRKNNNDALIQSRRGRYNPNGVWNLLQTIGARAGVTDVYPHRFRHTLASNLAARGVPIQEIQKILGHSGINTTLRYIHTDMRSVEASYRQHIS